MTMKAPAPASAVAAAAAVLAAGLALTGCGSAASSASSAGSTGAAAAGTKATASASTTAGAAGAAGTSSASGSVPFPVGLGNTWTYKVASGADSGTTVNKMTAVKPAAGGQQVTMTTTDDLLGKNIASNETYIFGSDGSIVYPLTQLQATSGVTVSGNGVVWPPASVIDSGKSSKSDLKLSIKADGEALSTTAHITVQGAGTQTVTVPAGTYQATVVLMTEAVSVAGFTVNDQIKVWLAPGVGPVKDEVLSSSLGSSQPTVTEELESFTKG